MDGQGPDENGLFTCTKGELIDIVLDTIPFDMNADHYGVGLVMSAIRVSPQDTGHYKWRGTGS